MKTHAHASGNINSHKFAIFYLSMALAPFLASQQSQNNNLLQHYKEFNKYFWQQRSGNKFIL
jgi:hypothetical protein